MRVSILTEGSKKIGFGHIMRCMSLYEAFEDRGIIPELLINGDNAVSELLKNKNKRMLNWLDNKGEALGLIKGSDIVIIDSYLASKNFYKAASTAAKKIVYIDDIKRIDYPAGIVLNGSICAEDIAYPNTNDVTYLLGARYALLRRIFQGPFRKVVNKDVKNAVIIFGGSDVRKMVPRILRFLRKKKYGFTRNVVIGRGFENIKEIEGLKDERTNLIYYPDDNKIRKVMLKSDIAISAGGQTLYELARVGIPTIAIAVAENQLNNIRGFVRSGFVEYIGSWNDNALFGKLSKAVELVNNYRERVTRYNIGKRLVDGQGTKRIVSALLN